METVASPKGLTPTLQARIIAAVDRGFDAEVTFLESLVREPSVRGNTNGAQSVVAGQLRAHGLDVIQETLDVQRLAALAEYAPVEWSYDGLVNVVGNRNGADPDGRSMVLNGHIDVVPPEPLSQWTHDPFGAEIQGDRMYGRGTLDMKGGFAAAIFALEALSAAGIGLRGDVSVQSVFDEECSGNGTLALLERGHLGDAAMIAEPTGQKVISAYVGVMWARITVRGRGAHVKMATAGISAADKAYEVIRSLRELEAQWNRNPPPSVSALQHPININIGMVRAGSWPSAVPEEAVLDVRFACYPNETVTEAQAHIRAHLEAFSGRDAWLREHPLEIEWTGFRAEGAVHDLDHELYRLIGEHHRTITGTDLRSEPQACTFDGRYFTQRDCPVVLYGPIGEQLHASDEWVTLTSVREVTRVIALTVAQWCGVVV
jgi:acetylornithine deacetylase